MQANTPWEMLPSRQRTRSAPRNSTRFAAQYSARGLPCERFTAVLTDRTSCITRGRGGWLDLPRGGLAPPILCQLSWRTLFRVKNGCGGPPRARRLPPPLPSTRSCMASASSTDGSACIRYPGQSRRFLTARLLCGRISVHTQLRTGPSMDKRRLLPTRSASSCRRAADATLDADGAWCRLSAGAPSIDHRILSRSRCRPL